MDARFAEYIDIAYKSHGRDHSGADCYGLFWLVQKELFGVDLPSWEGQYDIDDREEIRALINRQILTRSVPIPSGREGTGDGVLLRGIRGGLHLGCVVERGRMLHVQYGTRNSAIERYDSPIWRNRVISFFRPINVT